MDTMRKPLKLLCVLLALALAAVPAALAESFEAVVSVEQMNVYAEKAPHGLLGTLPQGTVVTVNAWSGIAALISYNGMTGIARISDMSRVTEAATAPEESARAMVTNRQTKVYQRPSTSSRSATLEAGVTLQVLAVKGDCAKVGLNDRVGYMFYSHLSAPSAVTTPTETPAATETPATVETPADVSVQTYNMSVLTAQAAQVYENADYSGLSASLPANTQLTLLAVRGDVAMVEKNGAIGYLPVASLKKDDGSGKASATKAPDKTKVNPFPSGSNEYTIYDFLIGTMGLNRAGAMGVMANIYYESGYKPVCNGDGGTSYGICQWHAGRKTNLINWCNENGEDYTTLIGQLKFLNYELPTRYPSVYKYVKQVENTADGAYDAAYYFCFNFEAPANRTAQSTKRGNYAKNTLFEK